MTVATEYEAFLDHLDQLFAAQGAQQLFAAGSETGRSAHVLNDPDVLPPPWIRGWDRVILTAATGRQTLYAVCQADGRTVPALGASWDALVAGIGERGAWAVPAMEMVVVAVYSGAVDHSVRRQVVRLTPSAYIPGLHPSTLVVDLAERRVWAGHAWSKPDGLRLVEDAMAPSNLTPDHVQALQQARTAQTHAFYHLMQGRQPVVTYLLIAVNVVMYAVTVAMGGPASESTLQHLGALTYNLALQGQWWRLFTTMFLHGGVEHILFNMMSLFAVGTLAERLYGSRKYLAIYVGSGLIASVTSLAWAALHNNLSGTAIGASGAIFGVAGALVTMRFQPSDVIPADLRRRVTSSMAPMIAVSLPLSALLGANVDSSAHVGGLLGGVMLSLVLGVSRSRVHLSSSALWLRRRSG